MVDAVLSASRVLVAVAARSLADAGEDVTLTQYRSLVVLASRGPQTVAELAELLAVTPPTASAAVRPAGQEGADTPAGGSARSSPGAHRPDRDGPRAHRRGHRPPPARDRRAAWRRFPLETQRSVVTALTHLAEVAGEVPEQDWSAGWDL